jgi:hypothetical protein
MIIWTSGDAVTKTEVRGMGSLGGYPTPVTNSRRDTNADTKKNQFTTGQSESQRPRGTKKPPYNASISVTVKQNRHTIQPKFHGTAREATVINDPAQVPWNCSQHQYWDSKRLQAPAAPLTESISVSADIPPIREGSTSSTPKHGLDTR